VYLRHNLNRPHYLFPHGETISAIGSKDGIGFDSAVATKSFSSKLPALLSRVSQTKRDLGHPAGLVQLVRDDAIERPIVCHVDELDLGAPVL
jgi:hypothetical protein